MAPRLRAAREDRKPGGAGASPPSRTTAYLFAATGSWSRPLVEIRRIGRRRVAGAVAAMVAGPDLASPRRHRIGIGAALMVIMRVVASHRAMVGFERLLIGPQVALILRLQIGLDLRAARRCRGRLCCNLVVCGRNAALCHHGGGEKKQV